MSASCLYPAYTFVIDIDIRITHLCFQVYGDKGQPTAEKSKLGSCESCPSWAFKSKTEKDRHISLFHRTRSTKRTMPQMKKTKPKLACPYTGCGKMYSSQSALSRHRTAEKHRARDVPASETSKKKTKSSKKKNRMTISDMMRQVSIFLFRTKL